MNDMTDLNTTDIQLLTPQDATVALTLIDIGVRQMGLKLMQMPGGFAALDVVCKKLEQMQADGRGV